MPFKAFKNMSGRARQAHGLKHPHASSSKSPTLITVYLGDRLSLTVLVTTNYYNSVVEGKATTITAHGESE